ncbi:retrovirus-related pol polyprotein from transposon TNT 1-94 [Tanacetum coccineum]
MESVISNQHDVIPVIDDEETLIMEEVSRSKMLAKQTDPISKEKKIKTTPANYVELNRFSEDFVKIEAPRKLPTKSESFNMCLDLEAELIKRKNMVERDVYIELSNSFAKLEKHFISLELDIQFNEQIFQKDKSCNNKNALEILEYFKNNGLKSQLQAKDTTICKLKEHIKSMRENNKEEKVKQEMDEIKTINIELEHSVAKLLSKNEFLHKEIEHLKKIYKDQFDSIKKTRALSKEHRESLIAQLNSKSMENVYLKNRVKDPTCDANVKHTMLNVNSKLICVNCKQCMFDANHDVCFLDFVNDVNVRSKSKSAKQIQQHNIWKPTGKVFTEVGYKWEPTGRLFTLVGNSCPLTRITSSKLVPLKETTSHSVEIQKSELKIYSKKPRQGSNATDVPSSSSLVNDRLARLFSGTVRFGNDQITKIIGYGDYQLGNVTISRNLDDVDLLLGSRYTNLYTISLGDMLKTSPIYLLSNASKTKSWLWHRRSSHLNFGTLNKLTKDGLARGIPKLKFKKDNLCSACAVGKSKKSSDQPKAEDTNQEKLYLLHMDLCGPMHVESINGKKYILLIVDDYS